MVGGGTHPQSHNECVNQSSMMTFTAPSLGAAGRKHAASSISVPQIPQAVVWYISPHRGQSASQWVGAPGMSGFGEQQEQSEEKRVTGKPEVCEHWEEGWDRGNEKPGGAEVWGAKVRSATY